MIHALRTLLLPHARCRDAGSERSYQDLFERLDANRDGRVDVAELRAGLKAMGIFRQGAAQVPGARARGLRVSTWVVCGAVIKPERLMLYLPPAEDRLVWGPEQRRQPGLPGVHPIPEGAREEAAADVQESGPEQRR